jgi:hypothetical protein
MHTSRESDGSAITVTADHPFWVDAGHMLLMQGRPVQAGRSTRPAGAAGATPAAGGYRCLRHLLQAGHGHGACFERVKQIYAAAGAAERLELDLFPGEHGWSGRRSEAFFRRFLEGV